MQKNNKYSKILIIRTDRLGDCILSTPVPAVLKKIFPAAQIDVLTTPYTMDVFTNNPAISEVIIDDPKASIFSREFLALAGKIRANKYDVCYILHLTFRAALLAFISGIPIRVSPASKIYQFLSTNRIIQKRSSCQMNEAEYNVDLILKHLNIQNEQRSENGNTKNSIINTASSLYFDGASDNFVNTFLNTEFHDKRKISYDEFKKSGKKMITVHPGSGGSALNMSADRYIELMDKLFRNGYEVFLSTGPAEECLKNYYLSKLSFAPLCYRNDFFKASLSLKNTFALLDKSDAVIAPSTGIMHAAVALNKPVITVFCPIFVCVPKRWGPDPNARCQTAILMPEVKCGTADNIINEKYCKKCLKNNCMHYNCMDKIPISEVMDKLNLILK
ncbi:MAG: glycosyltransferase family 9 protein [Candidatus Wallbacteria bacterium]